MSTPITDETPMNELWIAMREEAGWPQPWISLMYPGYLDGVRSRAARR